ncbi:hypothetical protein NEFER03_1176 [Nematocida sp. LUAm3]|nr:hypothetical protein NEFER03_1176 [Nematocida sp. LUAm3]KAI5175785.1 hypothetical protein NEFER02_1654 [Nematocida sp. LUAm2]KAI5178281.1 hypothetical protein NEFER01_1448 [Nematocida sp. LUAm1]
MIEEGKEREKANYQEDADNIEAEEEQIKKRREEYAEKTEKDDILFSANIVLFRYKTEGTRGWVGRGRGKIRVSKAPNTTKHRILHVREKVFKLGCNHYIEKSTVLKKHPSEEHALMWVTTGDDCGDGLSKVQQYLAKFSTAKEAEEFETAIESAKSTIGQEHITKAHKEEDSSSSKETEKTPEKEQETKKTSSTEEKKSDAPHKEEPTKEEATKSSEKDEKKI